ncbi:MAG: hypothetical protein V1493_03450 [Candidatus Diapherotrites archaeon]
MPKLASSFFSIRFGKSEATRLLEKRLKERGFKDFEIRACSLFFRPRYFFEYCIVDEAGGEGKKIVQGFSSEKGLFDPSKKEILLGAPVLALSAAGLENEFEPDAEFSVGRPALRRNDAKKIVRILLSKEKKVPLPSIDILDFSLCFLPRWHFRVEAGKNVFDVGVNASTGELKELVPIPSEKQSWGEAAEETFADLKKPKNWLSYCAGVPSTCYSGFCRIAGALGLKNFLGLLWRNRDLQIAVAVLVLAILIYLAFR